MTVIIRTTVADHGSYMTLYDGETRDYNEEGDVEHLGVITCATASADGSTGLTRVRMGQTRSDLGHCRYERTTF